MIDKAEVAGIQILTAKDQTELLDYLVLGNQVRHGMLVAINAEKVILAEDDPQLAKVIAQADYNYADGISIVCTLRRKFPKYRDIQRIAGADLWQALMQRAGEQGIPVFLLGGDAQTLEKTVVQLGEKWGVPIVGAQHGYFSDEQELEIIQQIAQSGAKIVCVAMGSPKQEYLIQRIRLVYPEALYMGVGGSYDVFVGKVKRAPILWQKYGLEWCYRLLTQPTRWKRQLRLLKYGYYYLTKRL